MIITYHGKQFFKLQQGDFTLAYNPLSKDADIDNKQTRFKADITLVSARHPYYNGVDATTFGDAEPFVIQGPGSYELGGVTVNGFKTESIINDERYINTIYFVVIDGISYCFVGDLHDPQLDQHIKEYSDQVDVMLVPIGGEGTLTPSQAAKVIKIFSPKVIIPMDYKVGRDPESLKAFLKEMGSESQPEEKYVFKRSDIDGLSGRVVVLDEQ
jgi:L-ascorbate metabolism protein UlaG (beta-lactamase superfamily)